MVSAKWSSPTVYLVPTSLPTGPVRSSVVRITSIYPFPRRSPDHALDKRIREEVEESGTTLTEIFGIGPARAARIMGTLGDVLRFPSKAHFASSTRALPPSRRRAGTS